MTVLRVDTIAGIGQTFGPLLDGDLEFNSQNFIVLPKGSSNQQGVLRTTEDVIGVGGTHYDNLVLALPLNEATQFKDVSSRGRNPGAYGNVAISTAQSKYYGSSAYFDGTGDFLNITGIATVGAGNSDFVIRSTDDFTIEFWENITDLSSYREIVRLGTNNAATNGSYVVINTNGTVEFRISGFTTSTAGTASTDTWNHISVCRQSSNVFISINGTTESLGITTNTVTQNAAKIGSNFEENTFYQGYLQDLRIYKGIAKYTANFTPPERIAEIGVGFKTGALRYNTDSNKPELYDGNQWTELQLSSPALGRGADTGPGARGVFVTGYTASSPANVANSDYINIASTGDAQDFGNLAKALRYSAGCSSNTRGLTFSGYEGPAYSTTIYKTTIASTGSHASFGDVTPLGRLGHSCWSSQTRAIMFSGTDSGGGQDGKIKYVTIASEGNTVDFGDLSNGYNFRYGGSTGNRTRAIAMGGYQEPTAASVNTIQFVTISTLGDGQDFGDLTNIARDHNGSTSNGIKSVIHARDSGYTETQLDQLRPNTLGNSYSFGDLSAQRVFSPAHSCMSSPTRGIFGGGIISPGASSTNVIDYVLFATEGNAVDFGDMVGNSGNGYSAYSSFSNAHGGL